ncbi:MAG: N-6 DNA methylase [Candidatus Marinimicrobia bacterium]|nr:N-6 DNA methylase [Candidatus Neomarinimicrobiota bacterium]
MVESPTQLQELIEKFTRNIAVYKRSYNETMLRREFIDPFFEALGWDVTNKAGYAEAYKDVIHEDSVKIGGSTKAPDYGFRIGGIRKFFVETKRPAIDIKEDIHPAYQLRRYAWSAKLPLSILTDFEEFAVYDCRIKPVKTDKASTARILYLTYKDYLARWDEIASVFSKEEVLKGSFDRYVETTKRKKGTAEVDNVFLREIEAWRNELVRNIALRNTELSQRDLNFAVARTIDRIIFLRIAEDRGMEDYGQLMALQNGSQVYQRLKGIFHRADEKYNSGLFHFHREKNRTEPPDELSLKLLIDDKILKDIFKRLYYPDSPYEFSVLPADILGHIYEQFLGKVIRLTPGHRAVVEDKPEVRKAGGVYYTPTYIVDYIVKNTVGKLLEKKTPRQVSKLKILDPACGSGSFLIGAYQYLLDWHRDWYADNDPAKWAKAKTPVIYQKQNDDWRLTTAKRKEILLNNIYGVDIDNQAVEVTKLSLLLKVLEGESGETINRQRKLFHERALPDLGNNIKCGNSLIGPDFYDGEQISLLDEEEQYRINAFDWQAEFPEVFKYRDTKDIKEGKRGPGRRSDSIDGFDAVIGNPPYVFGRDWKALNISDAVKRYLGKRYSSSPYQLDMFSIFIEKASELCRLRGYIGQIVPNVWLTNTYSSTTRAFILNQSGDLTILAPPPKVFIGITIDTCVYTYRKSDRPGKLFRIEAIRNGSITLVTTHNVDGFLDGQRPISTALDSDSSDLIYSLKRNYPELQQFAKITRGVHPYRIGGYGQTAFGSGSQTLRDVKERPYHSKSRKQDYRPFIYGRDLRRFSTPTATEFVSYGPWLAEPRRPEFFEHKRVYSRKILGDRLVVTLETTNSIADQQVYITVPKPETVQASYLAGILGSRLIAFFIRGFYDEILDAFPQIKVGQLKSLPIRLINFADPTDKSRHDKMVNLVYHMLDLHERLNKTKTPHDREVLQRQINATDRQIDRLVYELFDLTEEEIGIVEGLVD